MDRIKKNIKRIWNSKCKYLVIIACALILANGVNFLQAGLKFINSDGVEQEEKKSVVITSSTWESKGPGSFQVIKSAEWTGLKKATIKFDVKTNGKKGNGKDGIDLILVLDNSGSMNSIVNGTKKLDQLKSDTSSLVESLLSGENNKVALIPFQSSVKSIVNFTNDKDKLISAINGMTANGGNNFIKAYEAVNSLLMDYHQEDRELVLIFLTDGLNTPTKAAREQYEILKKNHNISISGIQYELGTKMSQAVIEISDEQYMANAVNLKDIFLESIGREEYEEFEITDYISKDFVVENISDIRVSQGKVSIKEESDGTQKVVWTIASNTSKFLTSFSATMEIDVVYQGELTPDRVIKTNEKEEVKVKLPEPGPTPGPEIIESEETPGIRGGYYVTYDPNLPSECSSVNKDFPSQKAYFPYEVINLVDTNYTCNGWQIKEWKIDGTVPEIIGDKFTMPSEDVTIKAIWTKIEISKGMNGTVARPTDELLNIMKINSKATIDTSIDFSKASSASNGRGLYIRNGTQNDTNPIYYYRGSVTNNNVLFAGICWQIVRTTESGGIKLIYNGVSSDGKTCKSTRENYIDMSMFNSDEQNLAYVGYMYGNSYKLGDKSESWTSYYFGNDVSYNSSTGQYSLVSTKRSSKPTDGYHYTCLQTSASKTCSTVYYVHFAGSYSKDYYKLYVEFTGGETLETMLSKIHSNTYNSTVKTKIDNWYKVNIDDKGYTKYLDENTIWCNDRTVTGSLSSRNAPFEWSSFALTNRITNPAVKESTACSNINDRFTSTNASVGNKALTYPVGMITGDELILGGVAPNIILKGGESYLMREFAYRTMSPYEMDARSYVSHYGITIPSSGESYGSSLYLNRALAIVPSVSLKSGTLVYSDKNTDGTLEHPYEVVMDS